MLYSGQKNKWFALLIFTGLPFYVLYKWIKDDLSYIETGNKKTDKIIED